MNRSLSFPLPITPSEFRRLLGVARDLKLPPVGLPAGPHHHLTLYLPPHNAVRYLANKNPACSEKDWLEQLAYAAYHHERAAKLRAETTPPASLPRTPRDREQDQFIANIQQGLAARKIVLAEASTGFGKSRVLLRLAAQLLGQNRLPWIAAPTVAVISHLLAELEHMGDALPRPNVLLGRRQFVGVAETLRLLEEIDTEQPPVRQETNSVRDWLTRGAPPLTPTSRALARWIPGLSHLVMDLAHLAPSLDAELFTLNGDADENEPAIRLTSELRSAALQSGETPRTFTMLTHAMLAVLTMRQSTQCPYTHLLIDEGHLLENSVASVLGTDFSFMALRAWLRHEAPKTWSPLIADLDSLTALIRTIPHAGPLDPVADATTIAALRGFLKTLAVHLDNKRHIRPIDQTWRHRTHQILNSRQDWMSVEFSPILRTPLLLTGPTRIDPLLKRHLWPVEAAVLVSGTMYLPDSRGWFSPTYQALKIGIPSDRLHAFKPAHVPWIHTTPQLHLPPAVAAADFSYPKQVEQEDETDAVPPAVVSWLDRISATIAQVAAQARGGTLVLCCSHRDISEFALRLQGPLGDRLLANRSTHRSRELFVAASLAGGRPVWLATGSAWTGIDLSHPDKTCPPEEDFILTDLVVPRIPYGLEKSAAHKFRRRQRGAEAERAEAMFRLRQGFGRLIRRDGLQDRHIWFLDGRPWNDPRGFHRHVTWIIAQYPKREYFAAPTVTLPLTPQTPPA